MSTKSSRIPLQSRSQKPARVPNKWRNLPAYGHGITPTMKARPVIESVPYENGVYCEEFKYLMPVSLEAFRAEHAAMQVLGYHAHTNDEWMKPCPNCGCEIVTFLSYTKRHRNGKPNFDWQREFTMCAHCFHVGEVILVDMAIEKAGRQSEIEVTVIGSDAA